MFKYKNGISLLVPTQNSEKTIEACIHSFLDFADEIIVVDNGSIDGTIPLLKRLEAEIDKLSFYSCPNLKDLYENRQFAFLKSHYRWIVRIDSDYIAYTREDKNYPACIEDLRSELLSTKPTLRPLAFTISQVTLYYDHLHMGKPRELRRGRGGKHVQPPSEVLGARILQRYPFMRFQRNGRWEGVRWQRFLKKKLIKQIYWLHCEFKSHDVDFLLRSERTNWREMGDFVKFPSLKSYVESKISQLYGTTDISEAAQIYLEKYVFPYLMDYDADIFLPYPTSLKLIKSLHDSNTGMKK